MTLGITAFRLGRRALLPALLFGATLLSGCAIDQFEGAPSMPTAVASVARENTGLMDALDAMDERRGQVENVSARLNATLHDRARNRDVALSAGYMGDKDGNFRLRLKMGDQLLADISLFRENVTVWLPRRERYLKGTRDDLRAAPASELTFLIDSCNACDLFFPRAWAPKAVERVLLPGTASDEILVTEKIGIFNRLTRRMRIGKNETFPASMAFISPAGTDLGVVSYEGFQANQETNLEYPQRLRLEPAMGPCGLILSVEEMMINRSIDSSRFEIQPPTENPPLSLAQFLRKGANLWE